MYMHDNPVGQYEINRNVVVVTPNSNVMPDIDDDMRYEFVPGARLGSQLLYTLDEKHMYRRSNIGEKEDLYVCNAPKHMGCRVRVRLLKTTGSAQRVGKRLTHNHPTMEDVYSKNKFLDALKQDFVACSGTPDLDVLIENLRER